MGQFGTPQAGSVECHQQSAMERSESSIDESCDFFLTEDRRQAMALFRIGSFRNAPGLLECLDVEESQSRQADRNCTRRQLPLLKQLGLVFANVLQAQAVRWTVEVSSKIFDCADVVAYGMFRKVTTLELFQHHFAKSGHKDLLMTRQLPQPLGNHRSTTSREASAAQRLRANGLTFQVRISTLALAGFVPRARVRLETLQAPPVSITSRVSRTGGVKAHEQTSFGCHHRLFYCCNRNGSPIGRTHRRTRSTVLKIIVVSIKGQHQSEVL